MISVGMPKITTEDPGMNGQTITGLLHMRSESIKLCFECSEPIGFMAADVCNTAKMAGVIGERGDRRDHRRQFGGFAQIKIDGMNVISSLDYEVAAFQVHAGAKALQYVADRIARLKRGGGPVWDRDRAAGYGCRR